MESELSIEKPRIARLSGPNYRPWSIQVRRLLQAQGLWKIVEKGPTEDVEQKLDQETKDAKASTLVMGLCGQGALQHILLLETAHEQWNKLKALYAPLGLQQLNSKTQAFVGYKPRASNTTIAEIATELNTLQAEIASISLEERPTDTLKTTVLFQAVRAKDPVFDPVILQVGLTGITSFNAIVEQLTEYERRIGEQPQKESAFTADPAREGRSANQKTQKMMPKAGFKGRCFHCNKVGHRKSECRALNQGASTGPLATPGGSRGLSPPLQDAHVASESSWIAATAASGPYETAYTASWKPEDQSWVIDSGCTRHMTYSKDAFLDYTPLHPPIGVNIANGAYIQAIAEGTVQLQVQVRGSVRTVTLSRVLYVPALAGSLISVSQLQDRGINTRTAPGRKLLLELQGTVVGVAERVGRTYTLKTAGATAYSATTNETSSEIWHQRFGHISTQSLQQVHTAATGISKPVRALEKPCEDCLLNKSVKVISRQAPERANRPLGRIFTDGWGPYRVPALGGATYFFSFTDDYTRKSWVFPTSSRSQLQAIFTEFKVQVELETGSKIQVVRCDNISEYRALSTLFGSQYGIKFEFTTPYWSEQNGVAERLNRSLLALARAMLSGAKLPVQFWAHAVKTACYLRNRTPIGPKGMTPEEAYSGKKPQINHLRVWGCLAYAHLAPQNRNHRDKLHPTARRTCLIGYMPTTRQYRLYDPERKEVLVSTAPKFQEDRHLEFNWDGQSSTEDGVDTLEFDPMEPLNPQSGRDGTHTAPVAQSSHEDRGTEAPSDDDCIIVDTRGRHRQGQHKAQLGAQVQGDRNGGHAQLEPRSERSSERSQERNTVRSQESSAERDQEPELRRSSRVRRPTARYEEAQVAATEQVRLPKNYREALNDPQNGANWAQAVTEEITKLQALGTWEWADLPAGKRTVGSKWVFTVKYTPTGLLDRYKARLVAQGFSQVPGDDFLETFSPTIRAESLRILLAIGALEDLEMRQVDVVSAYPRSKLHAEVYMQAPEGLDGPEGKVLRLLNSLYGLKQSGREWYIEACRGLESLGFTSLFSDPSVFTTADRSLLLGLYVDDMLILGREKHAVDTVVQGIQKLWEVKDLGEVQQILGLRVHRNRGLRTVTIDQTEYIHQAVQRFGMGSAKPVTLPVSDRNTLVAASTTEPQADQALFQQAIGSLMWVAKGTRFDIAYVVGQLSQHCNAPTVRHWNSVLRVFRYLNGTAGYKLQFGLQSPHGQKLQGFCDADYAGDHIDRHSVTGHLYLLNGGPVSWSSGKQRCVATSTTEAEYIALSEASKQGQWIRALIKELQRMDLLGESLAAPINSDNQGCIALAKDPIGHRRTKHIDVRYHYIRQLVTYGKTTVAYIPTEDMIADVLTKPLSLVAFKRCIQGLLAL